MQTGSLNEQIRLSKKQLETVFDSISDLICIVDSDYRIVRANLSYARFVRQDIISLLGKRCWDVFWGKETRCDQCPALQTFESGNVSKTQMSCCFGENERFFETSTYPVCDDSGQVIQVIECMRELTEEKQMLEQLIRSEKLASIGVMTAGIAHEMNNPLSGISGTASNMLQMPSKYGLNEKGVSRITSILECARRATTIMKDLLHLSRKQKAQRVNVDVNELVKSSVNAVHIKGADLVTKTFRLENSLSQLNCSPAKIEQVIVNMVTNAIKSVQEKAGEENGEYQGEIVIATQRAGGDLLVTIGDNGVGISPEIRSKIFDPFFSTRQPGQGTGLGLSVCHKIVEEHGGKIFFESAGKRTIFSIQLPFEQPSLMKALE
ncbi:MAG: two-component system sensor histidine kinase NtrB [Chitinispirillaceae bacterium]